MRNFLLSLTALFLTLGTAFGQEAVANQVPMADGLRAEGKIYVVVLVMLVIFSAVAVYLFILDRKITKLEKGN